MNSKIFVIKLAVFDDIRVIITGLTKDDLNKLRKATGAKGGNIL